MFGTPGAVVLDKKAFGKLLTLHAQRRAHLTKRQEMLQQERDEINKHIDEQQAQFVEELYELEVRQKALEAVHATL